MRNPDIERAPPAPLITCFNCNRPLRPNYHTEFYSWNERPRRTRKRMRRGIVEVRTALRAAIQKARGEG